MYNREFSISCKVGVQIVHCKIKQGMQLLQFMKMCLATLMVFEPLDRCREFTIFFGLQTKKKLVWITGFLDFVCHPVF
jgi:hypothetical protein